MDTFVTAVCVTQRYDGEKMKGILENPSFLRQRGDDLGAIIKFFWWTQWN